MSRIDMYRIDMWINAASRSLMRRWTPSGSWVQTTLCPMTAFPEYLSDVDIPHMYHIYLFNTIHCFRYDVEILKCYEMRLRLGPYLCWCVLLCNKMKLLDMSTIILFLSVEHLCLNV